jgi:hypothetical protein
MASGFKFRILRPILEEVRESRIEIPQRLLKNNRTDLGKKGFVKLLFPFGEFQCGIVIANEFLVLLPGLTAIVQSLIVNIASAAETNRRRRFSGAVVRGKLSDQLVVMAFILKLIQQFCRANCLRKKEIVEDLRPYPLKFS